MVAMSKAHLRSELIAARRAVADDVRRAAREELRMGAHCIKIMLSGGVTATPRPSVLFQSWGLVEVFRTPPSPSGMVSVT